jgi:hypothetical protein
METQPSSTLSGFSPGFHAAKNPHREIEMVFRLWGANTKGAETAGEHPQAHHPGVLALIEDAVASRRGFFMTARDQLYVSGLKQASDALVVSRQVQLGLQGFRGKHGGGPVAVSIAIDAAGEDRSTIQPAAQADAGSKTVGEPSPAATSTHRAFEPPHDLVTLLKLSKPAQILLTHDLCQQMAGTKGLPLKSFPGRFGVYEYLWTAEEKLELLQSEPQLTLAAIPAAPPAAPSAKPVIHKSGETAAAGGTTKAFDLPKSPDGMVQRARAAFQQPRILVFVALGLAALGAAIAVGIHLAHRPTSGAAPAAITAPASNVQAVPAAANSAGAIQPAARPAPAPIAKPHAGSTAARTLARQTAGKLPAEEAEESENPAQAAVTAPAPAGCAQEMDAGRLMRLGEQARGRGDYANAVRIFREVLACEPNNAAAREGLDKATQGERQH